MTAAPLEIRNVSLSFRGAPVLEDVSLTLNPGEFIGLIGPNGAGKSVLLKVILGLIRPDAGSVRIFGREPRRAGGLVSYVPQHPPAASDFPVRVMDVVLMSQLGRDRMFRPFRAAERERAMAALRRVRMDAMALRPFGKLSGGQMQRVLVARAVATDAPLLLLDEPTSGLDPAMEDELYALLEEFAPQKTIVLVSHDIGVLSGRLHSVACLNRRLHYHPGGEISHELLTEVYGDHKRVVLHSHEHTHP